MATKRILIIEHAVKIIECFTNGHSHLSLADLQSMLDLPKSTIHRILVSLVDQEMLSYDKETGRYAFGSTILRWSAVMFNQLRIHDVARPYLISLREQSGETATLTLRIGQQRMYIDQLQSANAVRMTVEVGKLLPLYPGAGGKAILSWLPTEQIESILSNHFNPQEASGATFMKETISELKEIREQGFSTSAGERVRDSVSVSSPLFSGNGEVMGAIGLSGPAVRFTIEKARDWGPALRDAATEISSRTVWIHQ